MEAKWLQNGSLEGSGQPLGADSASRGSGARGSQEIRCWRLGGLLGREVDRFHAPGGSLGGSQSGSGRSFWEHFSGRVSRHDKSKKNICFNVFEVDLACDFIFFLGLRRGAGADAQS